MNLDEKEKASLLLSFLKYGSFMACKFALLHKDDFQNFVAEQGADYISLFFKENGYEDR